MGVERILLFVLSLAGRSLTQNHPITLDTRARGKRLGRGEASLKNEELKLFHETT